MPGLDDGFRVRYLGCTSFQNGKKQVGISVLQRPLLELYSAARKRGEEQRTAHPLALTQRLDVSDYGLVVADSEVDRETGDSVPVITKVITPLPNIVLWVASRFNTRIIKRKVFGAAFVPIACSEAVVDPKSYVQLGAKQRFLVSLTHPSIFACLLRSVASPKMLECHAFVCATAEDAITLCSHLGTIKEQGSSPTVLLPPRMPLRASRSEGSCVPWTESESPSDITVPSEIAPPVPSDDNENFLSVPTYHYGRSVSKPRDNANKMNERVSVAGKSQRGEHRLAVYRTPSKTKRDFRRPAQPTVDRDSRSKNYKSTNERSPRKDTHPKLNSTNGNIITLNVNSPAYRARETKRQTDASAESEVASSLARIDERWEPYWNPYRNDYRAGNFAKTPSVSDGSILSKHRTRVRRVKDMATMTDDYLWTTDASSWLPSDEPDSWISSPTTTSDSAVAKSPEIPRRKYEDMVLTQTMDFDSESGGESSFGEPWQKIDWQKKQPMNSCTKVTYFGYQCYRPSAGTESDAIGSDAISHRTHKNSRAVQSNAVANKDNENRITIDVPYSTHRIGTPDSSIYLVPNPRTTSYVPQGIRSYQKNGQVRNWSNLSQISDSSYRRSATLPPPKPPRQSTTKVIRWSSEERLSKKYNFLAAIKRIGTSSFRKAKKKTGRMFTSFRNRLNDKKKAKNATECSEDSAYDTSEVCLSPQGKQLDPKMKRRRLSWSFHDLRLALPASKQGDEKRVQQRNSSPVGSALGGSTAKQLVMKKKRRKRRKRSGPSRGNSSSDSGVEEYYSDYSTTYNTHCRSESEIEQFANQVTRVKVKHGISKEGFHRWSHTDLHDELGYIP